MNTIKRLMDIGEFQLISKIRRNISLGPSTIKGIGDDCAVLKYTKDKYLLFATDMIIEGYHFRKNAKPESIGHKALAVNISDIAACGGMPKWAVISAGLPPEIPYDYVRRIYSGIKNLARRFKVDIVGGDTNSSKKIVLSVSVLGEVKKKNLALRSGAKDKDIIFLSGPLRKKPDDLNFMPRVKEALYLVENFKVNSMIDISDGFFSDLDHILKESRKGAIIYESLIPFKGERRSLRDILNTGEQFELIFTLPRYCLNELPKGIYPVGEIAENERGIIFITRNGKREKPQSGGYRHF
ncbi:MAG: thiamine-phosphate kinase [Candidatus Omnitrophota bacterium]